MTTKHTLPDEWFRKDGEEPTEAERAEQAEVLKHASEAYQSLHAPERFRPNTSDRLLELLSEDSQRKRRIELAEEEERARLRVREQWEANKREAEARQEEAKPAKRKSLTQGDRVEGWLCECERRAAEQGKPFDRWQMPGTKADFLALLHALDADLKSIRTVDSLDHYLSDRCKWPGTAGANPSALPLFAGLFPEAPIRTPGAVSKKRLKA